MQQEIVQLLKRAEELNAEINDVAAWQWWILRQAVDGSQVVRNKVEGDTLVLEEYRFRKKPRSAPRQGSVDLSDSTLYDT
jgi:hypothetical protein